MRTSLTSSVGISCRENCHLRTATHRLRTVPSGVVREIVAPGKSLEVITCFSPCVDVGRFQGKTPTLCKAFTCSCNHQASRSHLNSTYPRRIPVVVAGCRDAFPSAFLSVVIRSQWHPTPEKPKPSLECKTSFAGAVASQTAISTNGIKKVHTMLVMKNHGRSNLGDSSSYRAR